EADRYRLYGELLTAYLYLVQKGMTEIELDNFYQPGQRITIPLDPEASGPENAQAFFKKYAKARNTRTASLRMAELSSEELHYLEGVAASLDMAESMDDLAEVRRELVNQGYLREQPRAPGRHKAREKESQARSKPLQF